MKQVTFITGNQSKADYLQRLLGVVVEHRKIDLDEIQSLNLKEIVERKVKQAYEVTQSPVIVEDVSLEFNALNSLPGPFIKYYVEYAGLEKTCRMLDSFSDKSAIAKCVFGYYDGNKIELFEGMLEGQISKEPVGNNGYGWDQIFIPDGYGGRTRAELSQEENDVIYQIIKPFDLLREFIYEIKM